MLSRCASFEFSIWVRGKKRLLARSIRRRLIVSFSSRHLGPISTDISAERQQSDNHRGRSRAQKKNTHLIINKRQKGAKDNGSNVATTISLALTLRVGYNDTSTQHYTLETLAQSTPSRHHNIPSTLCHTILYPMAYPLQIHPSTTTTTLPSSLSANQCAPSTGFCGYYPSAGSIHIHIQIHTPSSSPIPPSPSFRPIHTWPATSAIQQQRQQFSVVFICHPISLQLDTRYQRDREKRIHLQKICINNDKYLTMIQN